MRRGRQQKFRAGTLLPWSRPPYGYRLNPDRPRDPLGVRREEAEAACVAELASAPVPAWAADLASLEARQAKSTAGRPDWDREVWTWEQEGQSGFLRDLFGPLPFRTTFLEQEWLTWNAEMVVQLSEAAYENRKLPEGVLDKDTLAVLADALEEAGCANEEMLGHLRGQGHHWRGCWAIDLLTGRG